MAYSFSRLSTFEQCRRRFFYSYIKHLPDKAGKSAEFGSLIHDALERKDPSGVIMDQAAYAMYLNGLKILEGIGEDKIKGKEVRLAIDTKGRAVDYYSDNAFFRGIIDVLGDDFILDWKTGFKTPAPLQLGLYQILAEANGLYPNKLQYMMLKTDTFETIYASPELYNTSLEWLSDTVQKLEISKGNFKKRISECVVSLTGEELAELEEKAADEEFPRSLGSHCDYCPYVSSCRVNLGNRPEDKLQRIELLEAELKQLKADVKEYVLEADKEIVLPDGRRYGNILKTSFICKNKKVLMALLRKDGVLTAGETLDSKHYNQFLEEHPEYTEHFKTQIRNSFGYKKIKIIV